MKGADKGGSLFIANNSQWRKVFFFFLQNPLPLLVLSSCTHVNDRGERGKKRKGAGGRKRERREERSQKVRRVPPLMNAATSGHHVFPSLVRPTTKHPPAHPSGRFSNPSPNRDWTLVHVSMRIRGILQTGGGARTGECNIDNNYGTANVCRITNRTRFWWTSCARYRTRWFTIKEFLFIVFSLKIFLRLNSDTRFLRSFLKSATIDLKLRLKL